MKRLLLLMAVSVIANAQIPTLTTVAQNLYVPGGLTGIVSTSGVNVTWTGGNQFTGISQGQYITITGASCSPCQIQTVVGTRSLTLALSAGTLTNVNYTYVMPMLPGSTIKLVLGYTTNPTTPGYATVTVNSGYPNLSIPLPGANYTAFYSVLQADGTRNPYTRYWLVPTSGGPYTVGAVETSTPPSPPISAISATLPIVWDAPTANISCPSCQTSGSTVLSVFGRSGSVVANTGDYTAAQVTNAVSVLGSYADPSWITSLNANKLSATPSSTQIWYSDGSGHPIGNPSFTTDGTRVIFSNTTSGVQHVTAAEVSATAGSTRLLFTPLLTASNSNMRLLAAPNNTVGTSAAISVYSNSSDYLVNNGTVSVGISGPVAVFTTAVLGAGNPVTSMLFGESAAIGSHLLSICNEFAGVSVGCFSPNGLYIGTVPDSDTVHIVSPIPTTGNTVVAVDQGPADTSKSVLQRIAGRERVALTTPSSSSETCTPGDWTFDASNWGGCTSTNTWQFIPFGGSPNSVTASGTLTNNAVVIGQGSKAAATISADTTTTHALFATAGAPAFRAIVAGDIPTLNQNTSGLAATATALAANGTNCSAGSYPLGVDASGNSEGCTAVNGTSVGGDISGTVANANVGKINGTSMASLGTGIYKNTAVTGVPSIAIAADFPTLNQNTSGTASALGTTPSQCSGAQFATGIAASGNANCSTPGGTTAGSGGYLWPFGTTLVSGQYYPYLNGSNFVWAVQFIAPYTMTITKLVFNIDTASGTCGGTCGLQWGIFDSSGSRLATSTVITSGGSPDLNATGITTAALSVTLNGGSVYFLASATNSTAIVLSAGNIVASMVNANKARTGHGTNTFTGTGASVALPATLGTITSFTNAYGNTPSVMIE